MDGEESVRIVAPSDLGQSRRGAGRPGASEIIGGADGRKEVHVVMSGTPGSEGTHQSVAALGHGGLEEGRVRADTRERERRFATTDGRAAWNISTRGLAELTELGD